MKVINFLIVMISIYLLSSCSMHSTLSKPSNNTANSQALSTGSLSDAYSTYFDIGTALNRDQTTGYDSQSIAIVDKHFNTLTSENDMKWESIQPTEGQFTFEGADALVQYANKTNKSVIGHALVWHEQTPDWVFEDELGNEASRELLIARMKSQIFALAGRYKNDIKGWDVVNEALNEDGTMRESKWQQIIGDDFIELAFTFAAQAAPNAQLYYNDYNLFKAAKMDGAIALAKRLKAKGIRIDGIGEQGHYGITPPLKELALSIQKVAQQDLKMMITELDISVLKFPEGENMGADISLKFDLQDDYNPYAMGISASSSQKLAQAYSDLFALFLRYEKAIDRVTFWGVSDNSTWRNNWPMKGRTDYPLPFDRDYQAKPFVKTLIEQAQR